MSDETMTTSQGPSHGATGPAAKRAVWNADALLVHREDLAALLAGHVAGEATEVEDDLDHRRGIRGYISGLLIEAKYEIVYVRAHVSYIPWIVARLESLGVEVTGVSEPVALERILALVREEHGLVSIERGHNGEWRTVIEWRGGVLGSNQVTGQDRDRATALQQALMKADGEEPIGPSRLQRQSEEGEEHAGKLRREDTQQLTDAIRCVPGFEDFSGTASSTVAAAASLIRRLDPVFLADEKPPRLAISEMRARVLAELSMLVQRARLDGTAEFMDADSGISNWKEYLRVTEIASNLASIAADLEFAAPRREDAVATWLKEHRDRFTPHTIEWSEANKLLDDYRLHADTGTALDEPVHEGGDE